MSPNILLRSVVTRLMFIYTLFCTVNVAGQTFRTTAINIEDSRIIVNKLSDSNSDVIDITKFIKQGCNSVSREIINNDQSIEIRYDSLSQSTLKKIENSLINLIINLNEKLSPLSTPSIVLYLLKFDEPPANYRFVESSGKSLYPIVFLYKNEDELELECGSYSLFCEEIYATTTHEITHLTIYDFIDTRDKSIRWFDEGLANFIEEDLSSKFAPEVYQRKVLTTFPSVSLNRNYIRKNIWSWKLTNDIKSLSQLNTWESKWNELSLYGASGEIFRNIINYSEKQGKNYSFQNFLKYIKISAEKKPLKGEDIPTLIKKQFVVDIKTIGVLNILEKEQFISQSLIYLSSHNINDPLSKAKKYYALSILASLDSSIPDNTITTLLRVVNDPAEAEVNRNLAATALQLRKNNPLIKRILQSDNNLGKIIKSLAFESAL